MASPKYGKVYTLVEENNCATWPEHSLFHNKSHSLLSSGASIMYLYIPYLMWFPLTIPWRNAVFGIPGIQRKKRNSREPELTEHYTTWYICELLNLFFNISIDNLYLGMDWINTRCSNVIDMQGLLKYLRNVLVNTYVISRNKKKQAEKHRTNDKDVWRKGCLVQVLSMQKLNQASKNKEL